MEKMEEAISGDEEVVERKLGPWGGGGRIGRRVTRRKRRMCEYYNGLRWGCGTRDTSSLELWQSRKIK
jgi:hypothetical protein